MGYLVRIAVGNKFAEVEIDPVRSKHWHVVYDATTRERWSWDVIGIYKPRYPGSDAYEFNSTDGNPVFILLKFTDPPSRGATGRATIGTKEGSPNTTWELLASVSEMAEIKREIKQMTDEFNKLYQEIAVDIVGAIDPTPISDTIGAKMAIDRGDYLCAGLSVLSILPFLGDALGKTAKGARMFVKINELRTRLKNSLRVLKALEGRVGAAKKLAVEKFTKHADSLKPRAKNIMRKQVSKYLLETASYAGMNPQHLNNWRVFCAHSKPPKLTIIRKRNKEGVRLELDARYSPKPVWCKLKTAKDGPHKGAVVYPKRGDFATDAEFKDMVAHAEKLKREFQCTFTPDGPGGVLQRLGGKFHSDFDKKGVYDIKPLSGGQGKTRGERWRGHLHNDDIETNNFLNKEIYGGVRNDQHGMENFFTKGYDDVAQKRIQGRTPDNDETYLIVHPDGGAEMVNSDGLREIYKKYGITNPDR